MTTEELKAMSIKYINKVQPRFKFFWETSCLNLKFGKILNEVMSEWSGKLLPLLQKHIHFKCDITEKTWKINWSYGFAAHGRVQIYSSVSRSSEENKTRQCREPLVDVWCVMQWSDTLEMLRCKWLQPFFTNHMPADTGE